MCKDEDIVKAQAEVKQARTRGPTGVWAFPKRELNNMYRFPMSLNSRVVNALIR